MEENKEILALLKKIDRTNRIRVATNIILCVLILAAVVSCVSVFVSVRRLMPQVNGILEQLQTILGNLEQTTRSLAQVDLSGMMSNMDDLAVYAQESLSATMGKLESLDLETLNRAIADLAQIIEPLAKLVRRFG